VKKVVTTITLTYYEGDYKNDMKHGVGEYKWATGNMYKGGY